MRSAKIQKQLVLLRSLILKTSLATDQDLELQAHWARYTCILAAGILENAIRDLYSDFVTRNAQKPVVQYAIKKLETIQNPNSERFFDVANSFKPNWGEALKKFLEDNGRKEAIDGIISQRHLIAHGQHQQSGITIARVSDYLDKAEEVLEFVELQLL